MLKQKTKSKVQLSLLISKLVAQGVLFALLSDIIKKIIDLGDIGELVGSRGDLINFELKNLNQVYRYLEH